MQGVNVDTETYYTREKLYYTTVDGLIQQFYGRVLKREANINTAFGVFSREAVLLPAGKTESHIQLLTAKRMGGDGGMVFLIYASTVIVSPTPFSQYSVVTSRFYCYYPLPS